MAHRITRLPLLLLCAACVCLLAHHAIAQETTEPPKATPEQVEQAAEQALSKIDGLSKPHASVDNGVVIITGTADDSSVIQEAAQSVKAATGDATIDNKIELSLDLQKRTRGAASRLTQRIQVWVDYLPLIPIAIAVLVLFAFLSWLIGKLRWPFSRFSGNPFLQDILRKLTQSAVLLIGILLALEILNAMALVGGVLGAAGVAGIAIGFAFKDLIENYIASILLSLRQPFRPQDHVLIDGHEGLVASMNSRSTVLTTFDGNVVRIPNAIVFKTTLINYTSDMRRRFSFTAGVGYDVNLPRAIDVGVQTLLDTPGVLNEPKPIAVVTTLGDSSVIVQLFGWVDQSKADFDAVRSNAMQNVKAQYDKFSISMPEPIYTVRIQNAPPALAEESPQPEPEKITTHEDETARGDISKDQTIAKMSQQTAREQGKDNMLSEQAPIE